MWCGSLDLRGLEHCHIHRCRHLHCMWYSWLQARSIPERCCHWGLPSIWCALASGFNSNLALYHKVLMRCRGPEGVWTLERAGKPPPRLETSFMFAKPSLTHQVVAWMLSSPSSNISVILLFLERADFAAGSTSIGFIRNCILCRKPERGWIAHSVGDPTAKNSRTAW